MSRRNRRITLLCAAAVAGAAQAQTAADPLAGLGRASCVIVPQARSFPLVPRQGGIEIESVDARVDDDAVVVLPVPQGSAVTAFSFDGPGTGPGTQVLAAGDTFNIFDFGSTVAAFAPRPVPVDDRTMAEAGRYLESIRPSGGTNIHEALREALRQPPLETGCLPIVLFLTDGLPTIGPGGEAGIREMVEREAHERPGLRRPAAREPRRPHQGQLLTQGVPPMNLNVLLLSAITTLPAPTRPVDLAICLDTSGSMSGLIESAKQKLWAIVNELATARPAPRLRVALLTYGNNGHDPQAGWVRIDVPLTDDLDLVSQKLFALSTDGGEEYVGRVLDRAGGLDWTPSDDALKLAVVAGNESADQDRQVSFRDACRSLIGRGVMVNSIYCGSESDGEAPLWREVALLADGQFACIDKDSGTIVIETPFDTELSALSSALNETYIPLGAAGAAGFENQRAQDNNAAAASSAASAGRAGTKAQAVYNCAWDLVDACRNGQMKVGDVETDQLPENMRSMSVQERSAYVDEMYRKRSGIQAQINELAAKRQVLIDATMKERALDDSRSFDQALRRAVREQAAKKGFSF